MRSRSVLFLATIVAAADLVAGSPSRDALKPSARTLLERADKLHAGGDNPAAMDAYIQAVTADPNAADLKAIDTYSYPFSQSRDVLLAEKKRAALRQYLQLRPDDWDAAKKLTDIAEFAEADALLASFIKLRPRDPDVYETRGNLREQNRQYARAISDYAQARALDPKNARRHFAVARARDIAVSADETLTAAQKRALIDRAFAELAAAEELEPELMGLMSTRSSLLRRLGFMETDPARQAKLLADAQAAMQTEMERTRRRVAAARQEEARSLTAGAPIETPGGWQRITSYSGSFEYRLPASWKQGAINQYEGPEGQALEQIYRPATITPEYCRSFQSASSELVRHSELVNRVYENGHLRGCFAATDVTNVSSYKEWRHTSFRFVTPRGVEDLTIVAPEEVYDSRFVKTIIDSIRTK
jgi:tetratricopeptide (TPR) repeat protein